MWCARRPAPCPDATWQALEAQLTGELAQERKAVADLALRAGQARANLEQEQRLVAALKRDMAAHAEDAARLVRPVGV